MPDLVENYQALTDAIVLQAVNDYVTAFKAHLKHPTDAAINSKLFSLRKFFHSSWFSVLCGADGDYILKKVESECIKNFERKKYGTGK